MAGQEERHHLNTEAIEISGILDTTDRGLRVRIKKTGAVAWIPRSCAQLRPGVVFVPTWLAKRINHERHPVNNIKEVGR